MAGPYRALENIAASDLISELEKRADRDDVAYAALMRYRVGGISVAELAASLIPMLLDERKRLMNFAADYAERYAAPMAFIVEKKTSG